MAGAMSCRFGRLMGRSVCLDIRDPLPGEALDRLAADVFDWLHQVEDLFDLSCHESEVNLLDHGLIRPSELGPLVSEVSARRARGSTPVPTATSTSVRPGGSTPPDT